MIEFQSNPLNPCSLRCLSFLKAISCSSFYFSEASILVAANLQDQKQPKTKNKLRLTKMTTLRQPKKVPRSTSRQQFLRDSNSSERCMKRLAKKSYRTAIRTITIISVRDQFSSVAERTLIVSNVVC